MRASRVIIPLVLAAAGPAWAQKQGLPEELERVSIEQRMGAELPLEVPFLEYSGREVTLGEYVGRRPLVLAMVYYECPMLCSMVLNGLLRSLNVLQLDAGRDFDVVVISINPKEAPELARMKRETYLGKYRRRSSQTTQGAEAGWHFLVGQRPSIDAVAGAVGFKYEWSPELKQYAHASGIMVVTPEGRVSKYLLGVDYNPSDLRLALVDAGRGEIGGLVDQVMLFCLRWDPSTSKYSVAVLGALRVGGVLTLGALGALMVSMVAQQRRRRPRRGAEDER